MRFHLCSTDMVNCKLLHVSCDHLYQTYYYVFLHQHSQHCAIYIIFRLLPLRIQHSPRSAYSVIFGEVQPSQIHPSIDCLTGLKYRLEMYVEACQKLDAARDNIESILQISASTRHIRLLVLEEIQRLDRLGISLQVDGNDVYQLMDELGDLERRVSNWDYKDTGQRELFKVDNKWDIPTSRFFIILPADLDSWKDSDPSTHQFRVYFLCDNWMQDDDLKDMFHHVHLTEHQGYNINRQQEFIQEYGAYVLHVLQLITFDFAEHSYMTPRVKTFKFLWRNPLNSNGSAFTKNSIRRRVNKAITYLQEVCQHYRIVAPELTRDQRAAILSFLDIQSAENTAGDLHRHVGFFQEVYWMCQEHKQYRRGSEYLPLLKEFVCGHGGYIDMHRESLRAELGSSIEASKFRTLLKAANHSFDISIKLNWKATRSYVEDLCRDIAKAKTVVLEIDGITLDIQPSGHAQYRQNIFAKLIRSRTGLKVITLINYPRPQEQCLYVGQYSLQSTILQVRSIYKWMALTADLGKFGHRVSRAQVESDGKNAAKELKASLQRHAFPEVSVVTVRSVRWCAAFDLQKCIFIEAYSQDMVCPKAVIFSGFLRELSVDITDPNMDQELYDMVQRNTELQHLGSSTEGRNVLHQVEQIARLRHNSRIPLHLTLAEPSRGLGGKDRIVVQVALGGETAGGHSIEIDGNVSQQLSTERLLHGSPMQCEFLRWDIQLSDYSASLLDVIKLQYPSVLESLILDVSRLSLVGFSSIASVLRKSNLERLRIVCSRLHDSLHAATSQILGSIQWPSLKCLAIIGSNIDEWIRLWLSVTESQLMCLDIRGPGSSLQALSHSSVLFIHQIIFTSSLLELHFDNVQLQVKHDWSLIADGLNDSHLVTFELCPSGLIQFLMATDVETFLATKIAKVNWPSFALDIAHLSEVDLPRIRTIIERSTVDILHIVCIPFDPRLSESIARMLQSIPWSSLKSLVFTGSNIDAWMLLLTNNATPQLQHLSIIGDGPQMQQLSPSSVSSTCRMVGGRFLKDLHFVNAQLQDKHDWIYIVGSLQNSFAHSLNLCANSRKQFLSAKAAVSLFSRKFKRLVDDTETGEIGEIGETDKGFTFAAVVKGILNWIFTCFGRRDRYHRFDR